MRGGGVSVRREIGDECMWLRGDVPNAFASGTTSSESPTKKKCIERRRKSKGVLVYTLQGNRT